MDGCKSPRAVDARFDSQGRFPQRNARNPRMLDTTSAIFTLIAVAFITASLFPNLFIWKPLPMSEVKRNEIALQLIQEEQEKTLIKV